MKFCNYTNFNALFPYVVIDFPSLYLDQYFEIAKFVYCFVITGKEIESPQGGNFMKMYSILWICRIQWCGFSVIFARHFPWFGKHERRKRSARWASHQWNKVLYGISCELSFRSWSLLCFEGFSLVFKMNISGISTQYRPTVVCTCCCGDPKLLWWPEAKLSGSTVTPSG